MFSLDIFEQAVGLSVLWKSTNTGLDYWTGTLDWNTGMDYWIGALEWTTAWTDIFLVFTHFFG